MTQQGDPMTTKDRHLPEADLHFRVRLPHQRLRQWIYSLSHPRDDVVPLFRVVHAEDTVMANSPHRRRLGVACTAFLPEVFQEDHSGGFRVAD